MGSVPALTQYFGDPVVLGTLAGVVGLVAGFLLLARIHTGAADRLRALRLAFMAHVGLLLYIALGVAFCALVADSVEYDVTAVKGVYILTLAGILLVASVVWYALRTAPLERLVRYGPMVPPRGKFRWIAALVRGVAARMRTPAPRLLVLQSPGPAALSLRTGVLRPRSVVVVSQHAVEILEPEELAAVLAHELAHLRMRWSPGTWTKVFARLMPFDPLVRWLTREMRREEEYVADDGAAAVTGARPLASALVKLSRAIPTGKALTAASCGLLGDRNALPGRLARLGRGRDATSSAVLPRTLVGPPQAPVNPP